MKLQKILFDSLYKEAKSDIEEIKKIQEQIIRLEEKRTTWEQNIAGSIITLIKTSPKYSEFQEILEMIVSPLKKDNGTTQLLTFIGMQIGESVAQYFSKDHETPNGSINHGVKNYKILPPSFI